MSKKISKLIRKIMKEEVNNTKKLDENSENYIKENNLLFDNHNITDNKIIKKIEKYFKKIKL
jgi:hypothetical protein